GSERVSPLLACGRPVSMAVRAKVKVVGSVGVKPATMPVTWAVSCTTVPSGTSVTTLWLASWILVLIVNVALSTVNASGESVVSPDRKSGASGKSVNQCGAGANPDDHTSGVSLV